MKTLLALAIFFGSFNIYAAESCSDAQAEYHQIEKKIYEQSKGHSIVELANETAYLSLLKEKEEALREIQDVCY